MINIPNTRPLTVVEYLNSVSYADDPTYVPSDFALQLVNFIKMVNGGSPENSTPVVHYRMIDQFVVPGVNQTVNMCHRGIAKSTLKEYLILYIAVYGELPGFGEVPYGLYVSDSIDNGVKKMRKQLELRCTTSSFLQKVLPKTIFTDVRWEFINIAGKSLVITGHGAQTGVRGTRENDSRPVLALLDDLVSDEDARSPAVLAKIKDTVYSALNYALHPTRQKIIWSGTPFNMNDPLYQAVESGVWAVNVYPVCEKYPCTKEEFKGSWEERFTYDFVKSKYDMAMGVGKIDSFNQEMMLRIMSDDDRLIQDSEIQWYPRSALMRNLHNFSIYITTDLATSAKSAADFSVISVWAISSAGQVFWLDGICKKQGMEVNIDDLFDLARKYKPLGVGIEVSGQQGGFIPWIKQEMINRNTFFTLATSNNGGAPGIRPTVDKISRFQLVVPWFKTSLFHFPEEMRNSPQMVECMAELKSISPSAIKSRHDDFIDNISMLGAMRIVRPSSGEDMRYNSHDDMWEFEVESTSSRINSYIV